MKKIILFTGLTLLCACGNKQPSKQSLPLNREEFKANLKAIHLFEAGLSKTIYTRDTLNPQLLHEYDSLFASHQTTKEEFLQTYNAYYDYYIEDFDSLYEEIEEEFIEKRDSLERARDVKKKLKMNDVKNKRLVDEQVVDEKLELNPKYKKIKLDREKEMHQYDD